MRKLGAFIENVESINPVTHFRKDLFGCIDLVAIWGGRILGIQTTSKANHNTRKKKILANGLMQAWLLTGSRLQIISWEKGCLNPQIEEITIEHFSNRDNF